MVGKELYCWLFIANDVFDICGLSSDSEDEQVRAAKKYRSFMWCEERWHQKGSTGWKLGILKEGRKEQEGETGSGSLFCCYCHHTPLSANSTAATANFFALLVNISLFELKRKLGLRRRRKKFEILCYFSQHFWRLWKLVSWDNCSLHASFPRSKVFRDLKLKFYLLNLTPWAKVDLKTKLICLAKIPGIVILFKNSS